MDNEVEQMLRTVSFIIYNYIDKIINHNYNISIELGGESYFYIRIYDKYWDYINKQLALSTYKKCEDIHEILRDLFKEYVDIEW